MNTSKLADTSEILSSIAVLVTLIFLAIQMHQNTQAIQSTILQGAREADAEFIERHIDNPELMLSVNKLDLSNKEATSLAMDYIKFFRNQADLWAQYREGLMNEETWLRYNAPMKTMLRYQRPRNIWNNYSSTVLDPDFVAMTNNMIVNLPISKFTIGEALQAIVNTDDPVEYKKWRQENSK